MQFNENWNATIDLKYNFQFLILPKVVDKIFIFSKGLIDHKMTCFVLFRLWPLQLEQTLWSAAEPQLVEENPFVPTNVTSSQLENASERCGLAEWEGSPRRKMKTLTGLAPNPETRGPRPSNYSPHECKNSCTLIRQCLREWTKILLSLKKYFESIMTWRHFYLPKMDRFVTT